MYIIPKKDYMITEDYVSFEVAKLLKERGFDGDFDKAYSTNGTLISNFTEDCTIAPTCQTAMKWLREVHNLFIVIDRHYFVVDRISHIASGFKYSIEIKTINTVYVHNDYKSYEEACEEAIKYCLKNLIKNENEEEDSDMPVPKTVDEAISTLEKILSDEDREYLLKNGAISMHHSLGRWIRNEWGLWTGSELKNELKKKGFEHPDDMSNYIIEEFIKYWNNKL